MIERTNVLLIEDSGEDTQHLKGMLAEDADSFVTTVRATLREALECPAPDVVLVDLDLPDSQGLQTFIRCHERWGDVPFLVLSDFRDERAAQEAVRKGAQDYLVKGDINGRALRRALHYAIERHRASNERRSLIQELEQSRKLEAIGQLAAGVAHEINTPTQYVSDNTRFLRDAVSDLVGAVQSLREKASQEEAVPAEELGRILAEADVEYLLDELPRAIEQSLTGLDHIARIVRAMKEFSHPASNEKTPTDLNKALDTTILVASNEWKYVAEVERRYAQDLPTVECLPGEINQVFLNLLVNAAHAIADVVGQTGAPKGRITVTTHTLGPDWAEVRIKDTGPGIAPQHRDRLFEQFFTTKEVGRGTGQGLAIARSVVVNKHGGTIRFETTLGRGTTFIVRLPLRASRPTDAG